MNETSAAGIVILVSLLLFFLTGIELAFAMALLGFGGYVVLVSFKGAMAMMATDFFENFTSYGLTVIPLFVLMGQITYNAGIAGRLYDTTHKFLGHIPGGLGIATIIGAALFKSICGSAAATIATFSGVAIPEMDRFGYSKKLSTGIVACVGATLGILIPPSIVLILFGMITEQSIQKLFLAGIVPALILTVLFTGIVVTWCRIDPQAGPKGDKFTWTERITSIPNVIGPVVIFVLMVGGMIGGVFSPTEAGSVGAMAVLLLALFKRDIDLRGFIRSIVESLRSSCMVLMLVAGSAILGHCLAATNLPTEAANWISHLSFHRHIIMVLILIFYLVGGSFIDDMAFMILATPIFYPAMIKLGYDPMWIGIMICMTVALGGVIPPVAIGVFLVRNITKVPMGVIYSGVYPFLIAVVLCGVLLFVFPQLTTYLPNAIGGK